MKRYVVAYRYLDFVVEASVYGEFTKFENAKQYCADLNAEQGLNKAKYFVVRSDVLRKKSIEVWKERNRK